MATINPANANTVTSLNGLFKEVYADKIKDLVPNHVKLLNLVPFSKSEKSLGNSYNEPVTLGLEGGITYGGADGDAFNLNSIVSFPMKNATVRGHEMVLRSGISVGAASRSLSSKGAFEKGTKLLVGNMLKSMYHRLEIQLLYGEKGIGVVDSLTGTSVINMFAHEWAAGIWAGLSSCTIDIYDSTLVTLRGTFTISSYDLDNRTVTVAEDLAAAGVVQDDVIYFEGAKDKEFKGLHSIAEEKSNLFGIANASLPLFQGNVVNVGSDATASSAVISFAKVEDAIARSVEKGLQEEEMSCMVNARSWNNLLTEQDAKRQYDSSYSSDKVEVGSREIRFHGQNGSIKIIASTFVKEGYAYLFSEKDLVRVGSTDVTFNPPGMEGEFFKHLENANGYEMRCYTDQALFTARPSAISVLRYIKS